MTVGERLRVAPLTLAVDTGLALALTGALLAAAFAFIEPTFLNLYWQIPDGAAIASGHFPQRVPHAIESGPLIAQEWLFEAVAGVLAAHGAFGVIVLGCAAAAAATPLLVYVLTVRAGCGQLASGVVALLSAGARFAGSAERAETFAVDLFALELLVLGGALPVWWVVPVVVLWANLHASVVLAVGVAALGAAGALADGGIRARAFRRAATIAALAAASTLATPHGFRLWAYAWNLAVVPNPAKDQLEAWRPLSFAAPGTIAAVLPGLAILVVCGVVLRRRFAAELAIAGVMLLTTLRHARMAAFLVVAWAVPLARALDARTPLGRPSLRVTQAPALALVPLAAYVALLVPAVLQRTPERPGPWQTAASIALEHHLAGNTYTKYEWAAYLTYRGLPLRVLIDAHGDPYPPDVWRDSASLDHLTADWSAALRRRDIRVVLVDDDAPIAQALAERRDWRLVARRDGVVGFAKR